MVASSISSSTAGQPRAAVIDFGGFLGVGSRKIAVDWRLLHFRPTIRKAPIQLGVTRAEVQAAPEYKEKSEPAQVVAPPTRRRRSARTPPSDRTSLPAIRRGRHGPGTRCRRGTANAAGGLDRLQPLRRQSCQTGFGPHLGLSDHTGLDMTAIGFALSLGTFTAMASQLPAGALVDAARSKGRVAASSILVFTLSALLFAIWPMPLFVYLAEVLHGFRAAPWGR